MADEATPTGAQDAGHDTLHSSARLALEQGRATIERTKELVRRAKRIIGFADKSADQERDS